MAFLMAQVWWKLLYLCIYSFYLFVFVCLFFPLSCLIFLSILLFSLFFVFSLSLSLTHPLYVFSSMVARCPDRFLLTFSVSNNQNRIWRTLTVAILSWVIIGFQIRFRSTRKVASWSRHLCHGCSCLPSSCEIAVDGLKQTQFQWSYKRPVILWW